MATWGDPVPVPELGEGWLRFSKARGLGERSERSDFQWASPAGQKFRSFKAAQESCGVGAGAASSGKGGKAKKPVSKGLKVPYRKPGFAESQAAAEAAAQVALAA